MSTKARTSIRAQLMRLSLVIVVVSIALSLVGTLSYTLRLALGVHVQIDERLDHVAQLRRVDLCLVAGDGAGAFQPGHAGRHGGAGQKHMVGNFF